MEQIVECVPNFSEGRDAEKIAALARSVDSVAGVAVLGTHADADHNRSVITFVGRPASVVEAALRAARAAVELIDLRRHVGAHPRVGALDVLPFVPVRGVTLEECAGLAREAGRRIWEELGVPVYYYESAALRPGRTNLEDVRRKGFEQLREEVGRDAGREPDVGAARLHPSAGACVVGARPFLVAYNVNLRTTDVSIARRIAAAVRGRDGGLRYLKALGFALPHRGMVQVSMNLVRHERTGLHHAFEAVRREAERHGVAVAGSEIVGLVPRAALDRAADYFLRGENFSPDLVLENRIEAALARKENLRGPRAGETATSIETPAPRETIHAAGESHDAREVHHARETYEARESHEARVTHDETREARETHDARANRGAGERAPAPSAELIGDVAGGGAAAAHAAALAAALGEMVARLVGSKARREDAAEEARELLQELSDLRARLADAADEDAAAFAEVLAARRLPRATAEETRERENAVEAALKGAANVPLEVARRAVRVGELLETLAELGDPAWLSDSAAGAQMSLAAAVAARYNVLANAREIGDEEFASEHRARSGDLVERAREIAARVETMLLESLN